MDVGKKNPTFLNQPNFDTLIFDDSYRINYVFLFLVSSFRIVSRKNKRLPSAQGKRHGSTRSTDDSGVALDVCVCGHHIKRIGSNQTKVYKPTRVPIRSTGQGRQRGRTARRKDNRYRTGGAESKTDNVTKHESEIGRSDVLTRTCDRNAM